MSSAGGPSFEEAAVLRAIGVRIAQLRHDRGWSQLELASRADLHRPYLTGIETGRRNPSIGTFIKIATALHVPLASLFGGVGTSHE